MDSSSAQIRKWFQPRVLGIGPGGEKGYYYLGALLELKSQGILDKVQVITGCSIGSIIGLFLVIGMEVRDIIRVMSRVDPREVIQGFGIESIREGGLFSINGLREKIAEVVKTKLGYIPNLKQLFNYTGVEFCASVTNTGREGYRQYLTHRTDPNLSCVEAAVLSSNIPFLFRRIQYKGEDVMDGAWSDPYPIGPYDDGKTPILGLFINQQSYLHSPKDSVLSYYNTLFNIPIDNVINCTQYSSKCFHLFLTTTIKVKNHFFPDNKDRNIMINRGNLLGKGFLRELARFFRNSPKDTPGD